MDDVGVVAKANGRPLDPPFDVLFDSGKGAAANEEDVLRVDGDELLLGVLSATLWWNAHLSPFEQFKQRLLNAFTAHVTGNRWVVALPGNLVYLVDENDAPFGCLHVKVSRL